MVYLPLWISTFCGILIRCADRERMQTLALSAVRVLISSHWIVRWFLTSLPSRCALPNPIILDSVCDNSQAFLTTFFQSKLLLILTRWACLFRISPHLENPRK